MNFSKALGMMEAGFTMKNDGFSEYLLKSGRLYVRCTIKKGSPWREIESIPVCLLSCKHWKIAKK